MASIEYIRIKEDQKLLLLGITEEGERSHYTVSEKFYISIGSPAVKSLLSDSELEAVINEDERIRATKKALSLLSYSDNNERTLEAKLVRGGFSREMSREIAREMTSLGYINTERQLERLILREANINLSGYGKLLPKLIAKGYSPEEIRTVAKRLVSQGEIDFRKNAKKLIEKKLHEDSTPEEKRKLLFKNGYKI